VLSQDRFCQASGKVILVRVERAVPVAHNNHEMLEAILVAERQATQDYSQRAEDAAAYGDKGLEVQLENMVLDESGHAEETERILRDWPL
jgi:bacterioferritin